MRKKKTNNFRPMLSKLIKENHTIICMDYKDIEPYLEKNTDALNELLKELFVVKSEQEEVKMMINNLGGTSVKPCCEKTTKRNGKYRDYDFSCKLRSPNGVNHNE